MSTPLPGPSPSTTTTPTVVSPSSKPSSTTPPVQGFDPALIIAIIGIAGTLFAAVVTQWLIGQRERNQWVRQQEQESLRWERERKERQEQWAREDSFRWHEKRLDSYSSLLSAVRQYLYWSNVAIPEGKPEAFTFDANHAKEMHAACDKLRGGLTSIELFASEEVAAYSWEIYAESMELLVVLHRAEKDGLPQAEVKDKARGIEVEIEESYEKARLEIRSSLGIERAGK